MRKGKHLKWKAAVPIYKQKRLQPISIFSEEFIGSLKEGSNAFFFSYGKVGENRLQ
ncbi:hypothetical protein [Pseudobacillus badius]|uniref:hypothetical protein n=1 Tax=Bacillus badius TaxID=1455 RepID=UPI000AE3C74A|nr:hypothetical protein [Bacillus badius]UAT29212.1 hypothetical protein K7T73_11345 [Bacillus badius]GLY09750.1 hypothetical protein Bbad01_09660 [Bacillus badius]